MKSDTPVDCSFRNPSLLNVKVQRKVSILRWKRKGNRFRHHHDSNERGVDALPPLGSSSVIGESSNLE